MELINHEMQPLVVLPPLQNEEFLDMENNNDLTLSLATSTFSASSTESLLVALEGNGDLIT